MCSRDIRGVCAITPPSRKQEPAERFPALSLSVDPANFALNLYQSVGFRRIGESGTSLTLVLDLQKNDS
jgi:hypothetical protein